MGKSHNKISLEDYLAYTAAIKDLAIKKARADGMDVNGLMRNKDISMNLEISSGGFSYILYDMECDIISDGFIYLDEWENLESSGSTK